MDWVPIFRLSSAPVRDTLKDVQLVVHPIIPEKFRKTEDSKVTLHDYPHSAAVVVVGIRKLLVIDYQLMKKTSSLLILQLYNPLRVSLIETLYIEFVYACDGCAYVANKLKLLKLKEI